MRRVILTLVLLGLASTVPAAASNPDCTRECLLDVMNEYLDALVVKRDHKVLKLAPDVKVTENGEPVPLGAGLWRTALAVPYRHLFADPTTGEVGLHAVADENGRFSVFAVRLKVARGQIAQIETVVARSGTASLFAPEAMITPDRIYEDVVPPAQRSSRAQLIAAANGYYEGIERADGSLVPAAAGCYRVENGVETHKLPAMVRSGHCNAGFDALNYIRPVRNRRYPLVDEERGLVWAMALMDVQGSPATLDSEGRVTRAARDPRTIYVFELFKISGGKIRRIDVVMRNLALGAASGWPD